MDTPKDTLTKIMAYRNDRPRLAVLKWQIKPGQYLNEQDLVHELINFYYAHQPQLTKQE